MKKYNRVLLVNDDGYQSKGIEILRHVAESIAEEVWVVAPDSDKSGAGTSFSFHQPIKYRNIRDRVFAVSGTPCDCVAIALEKLMKDGLPDLILSGINNGSNLGYETVLSGTVGAAMTGSLMGVRSIALSQFRLKNEQPDWTVSSELCLKTLETVLDWPVLDLTSININFPNIPLPEINGIKITRQGIGDVDGIDVTEVKDPLGDKYFWLRVRHARVEQMDDTELNTLLRGYITVTPLSLDRTNDDGKCQLTYHHR